MFCVVFCDCFNLLLIESMYVLFPESLLVNEVLKMSKTLVHSAMVLMINIGYWTQDIIGKSDMTVIARYSSSSDILQELLVDVNAFPRQGCRFYSSSGFATTFGHNIGPTLFPCRCIFGLSVCPSILMGFPGMKVIIFTSSTAVRSPHGTPDGVDDNP